MYYVQTVPKYLYMPRRSKKQAVNIDAELDEDVFNGNWLMDFKIRRPFYFKPKHREFYNNLHETNTQMSVVDGLAGTAKTYIAVYAALEMLKDSTIEKIIYIRSVVESADILINTTPLGMSPNVEISPIDPHFLHSELLVYDIIYNPSKTRLMFDAEKIGARTLGGLWMLVYQGVEAFKIWTGIEPKAKTMYNAAMDALEDMKH